MTLEQQPPPPPPQQQQQPLLLIVVTVGSTRFRSLSQTVISHELTKTLLQQQQHTLARIQVLIQVGNQELRKEGLLSQINAETIRQFNQDCPSISHLSLKPTPNIEFIIFKYSDSIDRLISQAYLVITHAGAGSILSAIKPATFTRPAATNQIEITPDYTLQIAAEQQLTPTKPRVIIVPNPELMDNHQIELAHQISQLGLATTCSPDRLIQTIQETLDSPHHPANHSQHLNDLLGPSKFKNILDHQMGFSNYP
ncbi:hypothetical protein PCANC_19580 [Puccinia coronata f. sp. avenae]|uniref:UDP-N-acetylglucosamine transferase subunit ALG13 n=1 Tax=Puccinia coronata f. sp. avenae TaxID=200324 RepID=A0A2N5URK5_9BASI|nr:hypothetical protein PCANC_19580 [Puccinia coronata f. sp. avenae]